MSWRARAKGVGAVIVSVLVAWALAELAVLSLLNHSGALQHLPAGVAHNLKELYRGLDRPIIQADTRSARYDPELFYTLKPGQFEFVSREFTTQYSVNRLGVRDDEASLHAPEMVVLGDSLAMGWGVAQEETFAQILERRTGHPVLNASVSSYGTVRELQMLARVDTSRLKYLIVQYCNNDLAENLTFRNLKRLPIRDRSAFEASVSSEQRRRRYWFGRYAAWLAVGRFLESEAHATEEETPAAHAEAFLHALRYASKTALDNVQIIVVPGWSPWFPDALQEAVTHSPDLPPWIRGLKIVRPPPDLDHFLLDDHWTPLGHRQIADSVLLAL